MILVSMSDHTKNTLNAGRTADILVPSIGSKLLLSRQVRYKWFYYTSLF